MREEERKEKTGSGREGPYIYTSAALTLTVAAQTSSHTHTPSRTANKCTATTQPQHSPNTAPTQPPRSPNSDNPNTWSKT